MDRDQMRRQIDALEFAQLELTLYLDVHPMDEEARKQWNKNATQLMQLEKQYTQQTGKEWPMHQNLNAGSIDWTLEPWPWDYQY